MGRYGVAYGGVPAHAEGARLQGATQQAPKGAVLARSYLLAPGEKPKCVGKLKTSGMACPNVATKGPHCAGHARQAEKSQRGQ